MRFARNASFIVAGRAWYVLVWFLVTPYVLDRLGPERFGVWSLLFLLSGYLTTLDLGLGASVVKFTAEYTSKNQWGSLRVTLAEILRVYFLLGLLWIVLIFATQNWILDWLQIPDLHREEVRVVLLASSVILAFANLAGTGTGILNGLQRMDLSNTLLVIASIPQILVLLVGLQQGYGLYAVAAATATQWIVTASGAWILLRRHAREAHWPSFRLSGPRARWFHFSAIMQLNNIIGVTHQQIDKILLTTWVGLRAVAEFELGFRVANGIQSIPVLAMSPLLPAFAELQAIGEGAKFHRLWQKGTKLLTSAAFALAACTIPASSMIIRAWVGPSYPVAEFLTPWLIGGAALSLCTGVATNAGRGAGRPGLEIAPAVLALLIHIGGSAVLIQSYGARGVGPAFLLGSLVWALGFLFVFARWARVPVTGLLFRVFARPSIAFLPAIGVGTSVVLRWPAGWSVGRLGLLAGAGVSILISAGVFGMLWWLLGRVPVLSGEDTTPLPAEGGPDGA